MVGWTCNIHSLDQLPRDIMLPKKLCSIIFEMVSSMLGLFEKQNSHKNNGHFFGNCSTILNL